MVAPSLAGPHLPGTHTDNSLFGQTEWKSLGNPQNYQEAVLSRGHGAISRHRAHDVYLSGTSAGREVIQWKSDCCIEQKPAKQHKNGLPCFSNSSQGRWINCWRHNCTSRKGTKKLYLYISRCPFRIAAITFQLSLKLIIITLLTLCCNIWIKLYRSPSIHIHVVLYNQFFPPANKNRRWYLEGCSEKIEISYIAKPIIWWQLEAYILLTTWSIWSDDIVKPTIWCCPIHMKMNF